ALPRAQERPAHGQVHRNGARPVQGLLERLTLGLGHLGAAASGRDDFRFPPITLALEASRLASISSIRAVPRSFCSSVIALTPPECSNFISRGTRSAQIFI